MSKASKLPPSSPSGDTNSDNQSTPQESGETLKGLPPSYRDLFSECKSLGLLVPNPDLKKPRAKLIRQINNSRKIGRSINHASVLLVGESGVGKSATINHLLGTKNQFQFAKTSSSHSETRCTQEFIIYGSDPKYEVKELPLGIIDTPGHGDTEGTLQDGCNLLSIKQFFDSHPKLKGHYPNLIFVIAKATDGRLDGENSRFVKSLRTLNELELVDHSNPNVVAVLTHACAVAHNKVDKWSEKMEKRKSIVRRLVLKLLKVDAPVVLLENACGEEDYDLEVSGDFTCLPNGELQPKNLYEACKNVLQKKNDGLGLIILNSVFSAPTTEPPKHGHKIEAKSAKLDSPNSKERAFAESMEKASRGETTDFIRDVVSQFIEENELPNDKQTELWEIAAVLRKFGNPPDLQSHSIQSISFFLHGKNLSSTGQQMLQEKFEMAMKHETNVDDAGRLVGQGYNILTDTSAATQVMEFETATTEYGIVIPKCARFEKVDKTETFMNYFEDEKSYGEARLANLGVNLEVKSDILKMGCRAGYNMKVGSSSSSSNISFLFEQQMFEIKAGNYKEYLKKGTMSLTEDFKSAVKNLPSTYDKTDECKNKFERFFNRFGNFLVSSAYGGGAIEMKFSSEIVGNDESSLAEVKGALASMFDGSAKGEFDVGSDSSKNVNAKTLLKQGSDSWEGGDVNLRTKDTLANEKKMQKWKASLLLNPTMLSSKLSLEPISTAVACVDDQKEDPTYDALKDFLGGEFKIRIDKGKERLEEKVKGNTRKAIIEDPEESSGSSCFPSSSVVNVCSKDGVIKQKEMSNLEVGDKVMGWDDKRDQIIFTEVILFGHSAPDAIEVEYLKITLEDGKKITLSDNHLVMAGKHKKAILARKVKPGDILFSVNENQEISPKKVLAVEKVIEQGIFCPITLSGNVIVDNVLASCYASVEDHVLLKGLVKISAQNMAHLGLMPMRALHKLRSKWLRKIPNGQSIHPYVQWLCTLNLPWMAN